MNFSKTKAAIISAATALALAGSIITGSVLAADSPRDYTVNHSEQVIVIENKADTGLFVNTPIKGTMQVTKTDAEYPDNKLTGAEWKVYVDENGNGKYDEGTDTEYERTPEEVETGVYELSEMRYGKYLLKETKAPEGFYLDTNYHAFEIKDNAKTVTVENEAGFGFVNEPIKGTVQLVKVDEEYTDTVLSGAEFTVWSDVNGNGKYDEDTDTVAGKMSETSTKGTYELAGLRYGKYLVRETKAPEGFLADSNYYAFSITGDGTVTLKGAA